MPSNRLARIPATKLIAKARRFAEVASAQPTRFDLPKATLDRIDSTAEAVQAAVAEALLAQSAHRAAVQKRREAERACVEALAFGARLVYAAPYLEAADIAALGLSPHATARRHIRPQTPIGLTSTVDRNGMIRLRWDRSGNADTVSFVVESCQSSGDWRFAGATTKTTWTQGGGLSGTPTIFRVRASKNGETTIPSNETSIYAAQPLPAAA